MDQFLAASLEAVTQARRTPGCLDFVVARDPLEPDRVNVYEEWVSEKALLDFRGEGPGTDLSGQILDARVQRHHIAGSGPP